MISGTVFIYSEYNLSNYFTEIGLAKIFTFYHLIEITKIWSNRVVFLQVVFTHILYMNNDNFNNYYNCGLGTNISYTLPSLLFFILIHPWLLFPIYLRGNWNWEKLYNFPRVTQLEKQRTDKFGKIQTCFRYFILSI